MYACTIYGALLRGSGGGGGGGGASPKLILPHSAACKVMQTLPEVAGL